MIHPRACYCAPKNSLRRLPRRPPNNPPAPQIQIIQTDINRGQNKKGHDGGEHQAAHDGARHGEVRRAVAANKGFTDGEWNKPQNGGAGGHENRARLCRR